jgi:hypothetical protein
LEANFPNGFLTPKIGGKLSSLSLSSQTQFLKDYPLSPADGEKEKGKIRGGGRISKKGLNLDNFDNPPFLQLQ